MLRVAKGRGFGVDLVGVLADVGLAKNVEPLRVGGHDTVFDAVMHHLDEVAGAVRPAVQVTPLGGAARLLHPGVRGMSPATPGASALKIGSSRRTAYRGRRSSGNSHAPGPRHRRSSPRPGNGFPSASSSRAADVVHVVGVAPVDKDVAFLEVGQEVE